MPMRMEQPNRGIRGDVQVGSRHLRAFCRVVPAGVEVSLYDLESQEWIEKETVRSIEAGKTEAVEMLMRAISVAPAIDWEPIPPLPSA